MIDKTIGTDVLVIGGGGGGLRAAIEAHDAGARVLVVSNGIVGKSGLTQTAVTGFQVALAMWMRATIPRSILKTRYAAATG